MYVYLKSSATDWIPAVPPTCHQSKLFLELPFLLDRISKSTFRAAFPLVTVCKLHTEKNAPVWKRLGVKLLLIECWASLYDSWCVFIKYRPNPRSMRTARQPFLYLSSKYSVCWSTQRIQSPKFVQSHKQNRDEPKAADWLCNTFLEVLLKVFLRSLKRKKNVLKTSHKHKNQHFGAIVFYTLNFHPQSDFSSSPLLSQPCLLRFTVLYYCDA